MDLIVLREVLGFDDTFAARGSLTRAVLIDALKLELTHGANVRGLTRARFKVGRGSGVEDREELLDEVAQVGTAFGHELQQRQSNGSGHLFIAFWTTNENAHLIGPSTLRAPGNDQLDALLSSPRVIRTLDGDRIDFSSLEGASTARARPQGPCK
jgi:hypothetical protein